MGSQCFIVDLQTGLQNGSQWTFVAASKMLELQMLPSWTSGLLAWTLCFSGEGLLVTYISCKFSCFVFLLSPQGLLCLVRFVLFLYMGLLECVLFPRKGEVMSQSGPFLCFCWLHFFSHVIDHFWFVLKLLFPVCSLDLLPICPWLLSFFIFCAFIFIKSTLYIIHLSVCTSPQLQLRIRERKQSCAKILI